MIRVGLAVFIFFIIGALFIISNENLQLADREEYKEFVGLYSAWISSLGENVRRVTGAVVASDWIPDAETMNASE